MSNKITVKAAIASKSGVTLYLANGEEMVLPADRWHSKAVLDATLKDLARHKSVVIDLDDFSVERQIEKRSGGFIRFVREKIGGLLGLGKKNEEPVGPAPTVAPAPAPVVQSDKTLNVPAGEQLVAIVGGKRVEGVEALATQLDYAAYNDAEGLKNFLTRVAKIAEKRKHTVDELLNFMRKGDLPIAKDGSIIAYKLLNKRKDGRYYDVHSGRVSQTVGSLVTMPESNVDDNRRVECSTGLHVARRGYLRGFGGNVCTLIKIAPEDVIAVPVNEPNKMRVCAYHLVAELPEDAMLLLKANRPMTSIIDASKLLADVIDGRHIGIIERVEIGMEGDREVKVIPIDGASKTAAPVESVDTKIPQAKALDDGQSFTVAEVKDAIKEATAEAKVEKAAEQSKKPAKKAKASKTAPKSKAKTPTAPKAITAPKAKTAKPKPVEKPRKIAAEPTPKTAGLTPKQQQILDAVDAGKSYRTIEAELHVCRKTIAKLVKIHRPNKAA